MWLGSARSAEHGFWRMTLTPELAEVGIPPGTGVAGRARPVERRSGWPARGGPAAERGSGVGRPALRPRG
jgi:hypothetical protein